MSRTADYVRKTKETDITLSLELDGSGVSEIDTGIGFFDHMLEGFARHGFFDLSSRRRATDCCHHTIRYELCSAMRSKASGTKRASSVAEAFFCRLQTSFYAQTSRPYLSFDGNFTVERVGYMDTEMVKEFFYAISYTAGMNLHIKVLTPGNNHHMIEAMFKAFARALDEATSYDPRITDILSTKGSL
ncbi:MAG: imidazoleglycerol-phosphate dehydratase [Roseburia hominis]